MKRGVAMRSLGVLAAVCLVVSAAQPASACIWDRDTLNAERGDFPDALELIAGKFLRHSEAFYAWRAQDRERRLKAEPGNLAWLDDLGASYDKLGQRDKAIEVMERKAALKPGLYETHANLGTFLIHAGKLEEGLAHIDQAIAINPGAHFGREVVQRELVAYLIAHKKAHGGALVLPLSTAPKGESFASFLAKAPDNMGALDPLSQHRAIKGVLGMMRFGQHDSPILLEVLGDLLRQRHIFNTDDSGRLAARAYLQASYSVKDAEARGAYRGLASEALSLYEDVGLDSVEERFKAELADADQWVAKVHANEKAWIDQGIDVDERFEQTYFKGGEPVSPQVSSPSGGCACASGAEPAGPSRGSMALLALLGLGGVVARAKRRAYICDR